MASNNESHQSSHFDKSIKNECTKPICYSFYSNQIPIGPSSAPSSQDGVATLNFGAYCADTPATPLRTSDGEMVSHSCTDKKKPDPPKQMNLYGFPTPGGQSPETKEVMNSPNFFVPDHLWDDIKEHGEFDFIVLGSGFTALAFVERALVLKPTARILMLERGPFWLPDHFQNLPLPFQYTLGGLSETFPFTLTKETVSTPQGFMRGSCPFVGGRSTFWSAWSPVPEKKLNHMRDWPESLVARTEGEGFWTRAKNLLHVINANKLQDSVYQELQQDVFAHLEKSKGEKWIFPYDRLDHAPLSVANSSSVNNKFLKFSVPGPLLAVAANQRELINNKKDASPLLIRTSCVAEKFIVEGDYERDDCPEKQLVTAIRTSQGDLPVGEAKVIMAMGMFPAINILRNSFNKNDTIIKNVGNRITGHFLTHITARLPKKYFNLAKDTKTLQIAAIYVDGMINCAPEGKAKIDREYHIQITALTAPNPKENAIDAARECPDYAAAASPDQLQGSEDYVLFVCAALGEISEDNPQGKWCRPNSGTNPTTNSTVSMLFSDVDKLLWDQMDKATFECIERMSDGHVNELEYWNDQTDSKEQSLEKWIKHRPQKVKVPGIVHEASGCWMGEKREDSVVDIDFRPHGVENVYVTGASIFPTSGSWNPTLTMCGFAQDLAADLIKDLNKKEAEKRAQSHRH